MCNEAARRIALGQLRDDWSELKIPLRFPEGLPNFQPLDSIRITDPAPIIRMGQGPDPEQGSPESGTFWGEMVTRCWSWPAPSGKPVYNFRSDGREFRNGSGQGRCLIPIDGFYEFTTVPGQKLKAKWEFRVRGLGWFCVAGLWRDTGTDGETGVGEAWTMLTTEPGPDIAPYHDRQIVILTPPDYAAWLDGSAPAATLCRPLPAGTLEAKRVR
jgi:putative SOS response-associated peptidase YedK